MIFHMTKEPYDSFISKHEREKRSVREQVFAMDSARTTFIFHYLENNTKIENRYYRYLFLHDNCATRIRDIVLKTFNDITLPESHETFTSRDPAHRYLQKYPWGKFVINIAFGLPIGSKIFDFALFFAVGMVGILITFLWFFSDHTTVAVNNMNIIWALPTHTAMAFFLLLRRYSNFTRKYFLTTAIVSVLLIASWVFLPQRLNPALIPMILAIALRGANILFMQNSKKQ